MANLIRKNFMMNEVLEKRMIAYCEEYDMTQAQLINQAVRSWLDNEDAKKVMLMATDRDTFMKLFTDSLEKLGVDVSSLRSSGEQISS